MDPVYETMVFWVLNTEYPYFVPWGSDHPELFRKIGSNRYLIYVAG